MVMSPRGQHGGGAPEDNRPPLARAANYSTRQKSTLTSVVGYN